MKFVFFGSSQFSVYVLDELEARGVLPSLIITTPDKSQGRKLVMTPNIVKTWAEEKGIEVNTAIDRSRLQEEGADLFLVASYGKILKKDIFDIPKFKTLNIHPSLLPKYRGPSPIISQILNDEKELGVSIMLIDEGVDTGPVLKTSPPAPLLVKERGEIRSAPELEKLFADEGARLFLDMAPEWIAGGVKPEPQDDSKATYTKKINKEDGLLDLINDEPRKNLLKIKAFAEWPRAYYFNNGKRVVVTDATLDESGNLKILRVIPEGKKEMSYEDFLRGNS